MNEDEQEEVLKRIAEKAKLSIIEAAKDAIGEVWSDLIPYALQDAQMNAMHRADEIVQKLLSGNFEFVDNAATVKIGDNLNVSVSVNMTSRQYDGLRASLLEITPQCPKDLEIESLRQQLKDSWENRY